MARWETHRNDLNAPELERAAKKLGLTVVKIGRPVDWLVLGFGLAVGCEVKRPKQKLRPDQIAFLQVAGASGWVLWTVDDVMDLHHELQWRSSVLQRTGWRPESHIQTRS